MAVELIPLGAPELGMTRGEMLQHIDFLWTYMQEQTDFTVQIVFAWLVAMFFIANKLPTYQFVAAHVFYLIFLLRQYFRIADTGTALDVWYDRIGLPGWSYADRGEPLMDFYVRYFAPVIDQSIFFLVVAGTIWWSISCRRRQPDSPEVSFSD